jgi:hypothetical protein
MAFSTAGARHRECAPAFPTPTTPPQPNTLSGSYFSFTRRTRSRLPPQ